MQNDMTILIAASVWTAVVLAIGVVMGAWMASRSRRAVPPPVGHEERIEKIKRTRPSLRNPMRTYDTKYDDFKTKRGLYEPVRPKGSTTRSKDDELEEL